MGYGGIPCSQCQRGEAKWRCVECEVVYCDADASGHKNLPVCRVNVFVCLFQFLVKIASKHDFKFTDY